MRGDAALAAAILAAAPVATAAQTARLPTVEQAPVALLVDLSSDQVLFARNPDRRFVPASITKVMTLMLAFEMMSEGSLSPQRSITVSDEIAAEWSGVGSSMRLEAGDVVSVHDLLIAIATGSANDASIVLAQASAGTVEQWTTRMRAKAREIGLVQSHFATPNGWPDEGATFVTARDLVTLARTMITKHPEKYATYIGRKQVSHNGFTRVNRDPLIGRFEGADGIKTGFTNEAGYGFLGSAKRADQRLVMVIAGSYSAGERNQAARGLMAWGFTNFERRSVFAKSARVGSARVQDASQASIDLVTDRAVFVNIPRDTSGELELSVQYDGPLRAPISRGEAVAVLEIKAPGIASARVPLLAAENVEKAGIFQRIANGIMGWFS